MLSSRFVKAFVINFFANIAITTIMCGTLQYIFILRIWNPITVLSLLISQNMKNLCFFSLPLIFSIFALLSRLHVKSFSVHWWIPNRRLEYIGRFLQANVIAYSLFYMGIFPCLLHHYVSLTYPGLPYLFLSSPERSLRINPSALFVAISGVVFGFKFSLNYFANNFNVVKFTSAYPSLGTFIKSKLKISVIFESLCSYGIGLELLGFIFGTYLVLVCLMNEIGILETVHPSYFETICWNCLKALSDLSLVFSLMMGIILLSFNLYLSSSIFEHVLTQRLDAPLPSSDVILLNSSNKNEGSSFNLSNCLSSDLKFIQYLAFCQLKDMATNTSLNGQIARSQFFAISQPGGHPHNWQGIMKPSLNLLRKFTDRLKKNNSLEENNSKLNGFASLEQQTSKVATEVHSLTFIQKIVNKLKGFPLFSYLLLEIPDASNRKIFADAQPVIWAIQGLSSLVAASFYDDSYGVVQKNIADILTCLIELQQVVDKVGRGIPLRRSSGPLPQDLQLKKCLRMTIRSSIYGITNTFKESMREIPVSEEVASRLDSYLTFQEG